MPVGLKLQICDAVESEALDALVLRFAVGSPAYGYAKAIGRGQVKPRLVSDEIRGKVALKLWNEIPVALRALVEGRMPDITVVEVQLFRQIYRQVQEHVGNAMF